jgi:hypothetical protein
MTLMVRRLVGNPSEKVVISSGSYRVVVVFLHVVHNSGLRSCVFACLVRHREVAGVKGGVCDGIMSCRRCLVAIFL